MKVKPVKFEEINLYRHPDFAMPGQNAQVVMKREPNRTPVRPNQVLRTRTEHLGESFNAAEFDDEFDGNLFDGVDVTEGHGDEFSLDTASAPTESAPRAVEAAKPANAPNGPPSARTSPIRHTGPPRQPPPRMQAASGINGQGGTPQNRPTLEAGKPAPPTGPAQKHPQTPVQQQNQPRPDQNRGRMAPPVAEANAPARPPIQQNQPAPPQAQPLRPTPPDAQQAPNHPRPAPQVQGTTTPSANAMPPNGRPSMGFVTSRAAELLQTADSTTPMTNLPTFNPYAESPVPKDKRTPGFDNRRSAPVKREQVGAPPAPPPADKPATSRPAPGRPSNFANPHQDTNRRIGMPGAPNYAMSPSGNRGAYKPPTFAAGVKRERPPLQDVSNTGATANVTAGTDGPDVKRQRVEATTTTTTTGAENNGPVSS
jgi:hypothetical protein